MLHLSIIACKKPYKSVFKLKFLISITAKEDNIYIMLPLSFMN